MVFKVFRGTGQGQLTLDHQSILSQIRHRKDPKILVPKKTNMYLSTPGFEEKVTGHMLGWTWLEWCKDNIFVKRITWNNLQIE